MQEILQEIREVIDNIVAPWHGKADSNNAFMRDVCDVFGEGASIEVWRSAAAYLRIDLVYDKGEGIKDVVILFEVCRQSPDFVVYNTHALDGDDESTKKRKEFISALVCMVTKFMADRKKMDYYLLVLDDDMREGVAASANIDTNGASKWLSMISFEPMFKGFAEPGFLVFPLSYQELRRRLDLKSQRVSLWDII